MTTTKSTAAPPTNGDYVQLFTVAAREHLAALGAYARAHPDELAVGVLPYLAVIAAVSRHKLSFAERLIISQAAYWLGVAAVKEYRAWKAKPAGPARPPRLRKVT